VGHAARVVEKERISDLCSNGLYYFASVRGFVRALNSYRERNQSVAGELYVAPLYNELIECGMPVGYKLVPANDIGFCGVPDEYVALVRTLGVFS
jgi:hypothetical protein